jgi:hypothetical protein
LASLRVGQSVMKEVGGRSTLSVVLLDRDRRNLALMHTILASVAKLAPEDVFDIAYSILPRVEREWGWRRRRFRLLVLTPALSLVSATLIIGGLGLRHLAPAPGAVPEFTDDRAR